MTMLTSRAASPSLLALFRFSVDLTLAARRRFFDGIHTMLAATITLFEQRRLMTAPYIDEEFSYHGCRLP